VKRSIDPRRIEVVDHDVAAILRTKAPHERLAMAFEAWDTAWQMLQGSVMTAHPNWTASEVRREVARRLLNAPA
jgi:hypothetical protein